VAGEGGVGRNKLTNGKKVCFGGGKQTFSTDGETIVSGLQNKGFRLEKLVSGGSNKPFPGGVGEG
jgi:hypothetical protein